MSATSRPISRGGSPVAERPASGVADAILRACRAALRDLDGRAVVRDRLAASPPGPAPHVIALGKAAVSMYRGACDAFDGRVAAGLVITRHGFAGAAPDLSPAMVVEAGHPVPDAHSFEAGRRLLAFLDAVPDRGRVLCLLSGGGSALAEVPAGGVTPDAVRRVNAWLLASGLDIAAMNRVRKALSAIKGGRLARRLGGRPCRCLLMSDVEGDDPRDIASGPLARHDAGDLRLDGIVLPGWIAALAGHAPPAPDPAWFGNVRVEVIATARDARAALSRRLAAAGLPCRVHDGFVSGDAADAGAGLVRFLRDAPPGPHVWSGETTVRLPARPGRGGRCQQLALAAALGLRGRAGAGLLAVGTDGNDGPGDAAGAIVDGATADRIRAAGIDPERALASADAGTALAAAGALVHTGPTGANLQDLIVAWHFPDDRMR